MQCLWIAAEITVLSHWLSSMQNTSVCLLERWTIRQACLGTKVMCHSLVADADLTAFIPEIHKNHALQNVSNYSSSQEMLTTTHLPTQLLMQDVYILADHLFLVRLWGQQLDHNPFSLIKAPLCWIP